MTQRLPLSVTVITLNEEKNLPRLLESVRWADEVVVVDSGSTDRTVEIAKNAGARVIHHAWEGYGQQKNYAQSQASHDWVLNLDADEEVSPALRQEIEEKLRPEYLNSRQIVGFELPRKSFYLGRWILHGGWYPNYLVRLAHKKASRWTEPSVHEAWGCDGNTERFCEPLIHYPFKNLQDQVQANLRYSSQGTETLKKKGKSASLFMLLVKPVGKFLETYVWKLGFLDGLPGFLISINAAHSMFLKFAGLFEEKWKNASPDHRQ